MGAQDLDQEDFRQAFHGRGRARSALAHLADQKRQDRIHGAGRQGIEGLDQGQLGQVGDQRVFYVAAILEMPAHELGRGGVRHRPGLSSP